MDYIEPATCTETQFRTWWREFEWENRVAVSTNIKVHSFVLVFSLSLSTP